MAVAGVVHLAVATRYGWHPDELYYLVCGRHPAWGYLDQPPLTPLLARAAESLLMMRLLAIAAHLGAIALAAALAAEFGGERVAQTIAAAAVAACPLFVGASMFFGTTVIDQLFWLAVLVLVARALRVETVWAWLAAGAVAGVGLENKQTLAVLIAGVLVALVIYQRDTLRTAGPWLAGALATALAAPNLIWNATHGWPSVAFAHVMSVRSGGAWGSLWQLPTLLLLFAGPLLVLLWVWGIRWLASEDGEEHRWVLVVLVVTLVVCIGSGGRLYYAGPVLAALFAAAAVRIEDAHLDDDDPDRPPLGWTLAIGASFLGAVLLCLPVLSVGAAKAARPINHIPLETYGWPQFVAQVASAASPLPSDAPVFTNNYGEAAALTVLGPDAGMRRPVYSGDSSFSWWGPPSGTSPTVLCVGRFSPLALRHYFAHVKLVAPISIPDGVTNGESTAKIYLCQGPVGSWAEMWPQLRHSSGVGY